MYIGLIVLLLLLSFYVAKPLVPIMNKLENKEAFIKYDLHGDKLFLLRSMAEYLDHVRRFVHQNLGPDEKIFMNESRPMCTVVK